MTVITILQNLVKQAEELKRKGNQLVVTHNYAQAQLQYDESMRIIRSVLDKCHGLLGEEDVGADTSSMMGRGTNPNPTSSMDIMNSLNVESFNYEVEKMFIALHANQALVQIRLGMAKEAMESCTHVMDTFMRRVVSNADGPGGDMNIEIVGRQDLDTSEKRQKMLRTSPCEASKLWYRRASAHEVLQQYNEAEQDLLICQSLVQQRLSNSSTINATNGKNNELEDIRKVLNKVRKKREQMSQSNDDKIDNSSSCPEECRRTTKVSDNASPPRPITPDQSRCSSPPRPITLDQSRCSSSLRPPPEQQRQDVMLLLSQSSAPRKAGEAFYLLNHQWWTKWCRDVNFFMDYEYNLALHPEAQDSSPISTTHEIHCIETLDVRRQKVLKMMPFGAAIPKQTYHQQSCSSSDDDSSYSSDDDSGVGGNDERCNNKKFGPRPDIIDNSELCLGPVTSNSSKMNDKEYDLTDLFFHEWRHWNDELYEKSTTAEENGDALIRLRPQLVRGHDFEVVPREVYAAFRSWYGEKTPSMYRRVTVDSNGGHRLCLYPQFQLIKDDATHDEKEKLNRSIINEQIKLCAACKKVRAKSRCTICKQVFYCGKSCQASHWHFHKQVCKTLAKQHQQSNEKTDHRISLLSPILNDDPEWGRVGLNNLGNTCFMNSALQCLSHAAPLTRHFLTNRFKEDLNLTNPLGTGGKLTNAYEIVIKELWMRSHSSSFSPTALKRAIAMFAPRFAGTAQHDSQEFLAYLLDGLHEDLNRVRNPAYIEKPDICNKQCLYVAGAEAWDMHRQRNRSLVLDTFYGQFKSTCVCPHCNRTSVSFDAFNHVSLEMPSQESKTIVPVFLFRRSSQKVDATLLPPVRYAICVPKSGYLSEVRQKLSELCGIPSSNMMLCDVYDGNICEVFSDDTSISKISSDDNIAAYETYQYETEPIHTIIGNTHNFMQDGIPRQERFGFPIYTTFDSSLTCQQTWDHMWNHVSYNIGSMVKNLSNLSIDEKLSLVRFRVVDNRFRPYPIFAAGEKEKISILPRSNEKLSSFLGSDFLGNYFFIGVEWRDDLVNYKVFCNFTDHSTLHEVVESRRSMVRNGLTLDQCLENFTRPERLDEDNMWYCSNCKEHVRALKTMELWRLPNILVIHLKRFEFRHTLRRDKLDTYVDCPLEGLDMTKYMSHGSGDESASMDREFVMSDLPAMYDLFAVTNHYGRMGFGHYTATARRWNEYGMENDWAVFDDSSVKPIARESDVVTPAAYVLFYRRRTFA